MGSQLCRDRITPDDEPWDYVKLLDWAKSLNSSVSRANVFVIGNDAADSDSIISAFVLAYLRQVDDTDRTYVPVVQCKRAEMAMRKETGNILSKAGVTEDMLVYYNDEVNDRILEEGAKVILTDHNKAVGELEDQDIDVIEVIDHHPDMKAYARKKHIEVSNSDCFLIAQEAYPVQELIAPDDYTTILKMLVGVCLLDTKGLNPKNMQAYDNEKGPELIAASGAQADIDNGWYKKLAEMRANKEFWANPPPALALGYDTKFFPAWSDERDDKHVAAAHSRAGDIRKVIANPAFLPSVIAIMNEHDVNLLKFIGENKFEAVFAALPGEVDMGAMQKAYEKKVKGKLKPVQSQDAQCPIEWTLFVEDTSAPKPAEPKKKPKKEDEGPKQKGIGRGMQDLDVWL